MPRWEWKCNCENKGELESMELEDTIGAVKERRIGVEPDEDCARGVTGDDLEKLEA